MKQIFFFRALRRPSLSYNIGEPGSIVLIGIDINRWIINCCVCTLWGCCVGGVAVAQNPCTRAVVVSPDRSGMLHATVAAHEAVGPRHFGGRQLLIGEM